MVILKSQQSSTLEQNRGIIEEELSRAISEERKHKFQGLLYVLDQLFLPVRDANAKTRIKSSIPFQEALEYFLAFQPLHSGAPTKYQRDAFREALLHEKHGLRINIIRISEGFEYVALRPDKVDLESLLLDILVLVVLKVAIVLLFLIRKPCKVSFLLWTQNGIQFVLELFCDPYTLQKK